MTPEDVLARVGQSMPKTLAESRLLLESTHWSMTAKQKAVLEAFVAQYEQAERSKQIEQYQAAHDHAGRTVVAIETQIESAFREVAELESAADHGRVGSDEAKQQLASVFRFINQQRALLESLAQSQERATAMVDTDPAHVQEKNLERFPSLASTLPLLTVAYLNGDEPSPFGGAS